MRTPTEPRPIPAAPAPSAANRPVVSVCIANWNCCELLYGCLASLSDHEQGVPFEVIVVDNGSTDGAAEMVAEKFPEVRLVRNADNRGFSAANNQAAAIARGEYLFFLNNDTLVPAATLGRFVRYLADHPEVGMIGPRLRGGDGEHQISYRAKPTLGALLHRVGLLRWTRLFRAAYYEYRRNTFEADGTRTVDVLMGAAVCLPRAAFEASGRWDETYRFGGEDLDLSSQVGRTRSLVYCGDVEIVHFGRVASRANVGFASPNVAIGYVHYFRKCGVGPVKLGLYKLLVTIDAPLQGAAKLVQSWLRRLRGDRARAEKSRLAARGYWHFLARDLRRFWRA
jgi:N-acetylglucosaminyl-diphospho-decaprenol L-rhamnosyltransferase